MYPSTLSTFQRPAPSDRLNSPSHSALHNSVSSALGQVEAFLGTLSSIQGTLVHDIRAASSNGGGHVQSAARGGTGQISFNRGDVLVALNSSTLTKLSIGLDGLVLRANSSTASGVEWGSGTSTRVTNSASVVTVSSVATEVSVLSVVIPGSTLGTNGAIRANLFVTQLSTKQNFNETFTVRANYGNQSVLTYVVGSVIGSQSIRGKIEFNLVSNNTSNSQRGTLFTNLYRESISGPQGSVFGIVRTNTGISTVDSNASQLLGITVQPNIADPANEFITNGYVVEKII